MITGQWFIGVVTGYNSRDETYSVKYDDGDIETGVPREDIRLLHDLDDESQSIMRRLPVPGTDSSSTNDLYLALR